MDDTTDSGTITRRSFLKGTGAATAAVSLAQAPVEALAESKLGTNANSSAPTFGPGTVPIALVVNGKEFRTMLEPRVTLLDALRDYLDVTGCKRVCDRATCGACTVMLDDKPIYACTMLAIEAQGKKITTCEGLSDGASLHPISQAFWNRDASQCGFCTPGFVVACAAVLKANPKPTLEQLQRGVDGNICRCGTYEQMAVALADLAGGK